MNNLTGPKKKKIILVDDDRNIIKLLTALLESEGYQIRACSSPKDALAQIMEFKPDLALLDLMMGGVDGYTLLKEIRKSPDLKSIKVIVLTAKSFEFDRLRAFELGADAFISKPFEAEGLLDKVEQALASEAFLTFWGTRGSLPSPGPETIKFGGNTSCIELRMPRERLMILDSGTGIRKLGGKIMKEGGNKKINLLLTHPHWDHLFGLPFFVPLYKPGNEVAIYGAGHGDISLRQVVAGQMEGIYFPITMKEFGAHCYFKELLEGEYDIDGVKVQTHFLNHPGQTLGYRIWREDSSIAYITDNELPLERQDSGSDVGRRDKIVKFLDKTDILIHDASYTDDEYKTRVGWGHPPISGVISLAIDANVKELKLFHHEPDHTDADVERMVEFCAEKLGALNSPIKCSAAMEGERLVF